MDNYNNVTMPHNCGVASKMKIRKTVLINFHVNITLETYVQIAE